MVPAARTAGSSCNSRTALKETTLLGAFELQRFALNPRLQAVIDRTHARLAARELSDDELDFVAAGQPEQPEKPEEHRR